MSITAQNQADVASLYVALFGRAPEGAGLAYWVDQLGNRGVPLSTIAQQMYATPAAQSYYPNYYTNDQIVLSFYLNVLGRTSDAAGQAYWVNQLNGGSTPGKLITDMIFATNNYAGTDPAALASKALFANKGSVALSFGSNVLNNSATQDAGKQILSTVTSDPATATAAIASMTSSQGAIGTTFALTTGVDNLSGTSNNDTFVADNSSGLNAQTSAADSINGGSGTDTLKVYLQTGAGIGTLFPALTSVEKLYINNADVGVTAAGAVNVSGISGVASLEIDGQAVGTAMTYTLKAQSLQLDNTALAAVDVVVAGSTDTTQAITLSTVASTAAGGIDIRGAALTSATITSTGGVNTIGATGQLANTVGGLITTLNLAGDKALTLTESAALANAVTTINAAADTGGVTVDTSTGAKKAAFAFTGGSGNDKLILAAGDLSIVTSGIQLNGGGGTDTLVIKDLAPAARDYTALNASLGFEVLGLGVTGMTVDASQLTGSMATHFSMGALANETISNTTNGTVVDLTGAMTKLSIGTQVGQSSTTVNLNTSPTAVGFTLANLTLGGTKNLTLSSAGNNTVKNIITAMTNSDNSNFVVTDANDLTFALSAGLTTGSKVDASAFTGKLSITGSSLSDILIGGSGADTIQGAPANSANQADTMTGGGGADTFVFSAGNIANLMRSSAGTTAIAKITDFVAGTDKISLVDGTAAFTSMVLAPAQTLGTAADLAAVYAGITAIGASTQGGVANGVVITVTAGAAAGTYLYVNDAAGVVSNTLDMLINITGITGTLGAVDFGVTGGGTGSSFNLTTATDTLTGTASNDTFVGTYDGGVVTDTFAAADTIAGGGGTDTLSITHALDGAIAPPDALWTNISAVKTIVIDATGAGAQTITTGANFNAAFTAGGVDFTAKTTSGAITIDMNSTPFTGAAVISAVTSISGAQTVTTGSGPRWPLQIPPPMAGQTPPWQDGHIMTTRRR
jgi:hypothetical protein